jgi:hypothetical protein
MLYRLTCRRRPASTPPDDPQPAPAPDVAGEVAQLRRDVESLTADRDLLTAHLMQAERTLAAAMTQIGDLSSRMYGAVAASCAAGRAADEARSAADSLRAELAQTQTPVPRTGPVGLPPMGNFESGLVLGPDLVLTWDREGDWTMRRWVVSVTTTRGERLAEVATLPIDAPPEVLAAAVTHAAQIAPALFPDVAAVRSDA